MSTPTAPIATASVPPVSYITRAQVQDTLLSVLGSNAATPILLDPLLVIVASYTRGQLIYMYTWATPTHLGVIRSWNPDAPLDECQLVHSDTNAGPTNLALTHSTGISIAGNSLFSFGERVYRLALLDEDPNRFDGPYGNRITWASKVVHYAQRITELPELREKKEKGEWPVFQLCANSGRNYSSTCYVPELNVYAISGGSSIRLSYLARFDPNAAASTAGMIALTKGPDYGGGGGRYHHASVGVRSHAIVLGGKGVTARGEPPVLNSVWCYDMRKDAAASSAAVELPAMATARYQCGAVLYTPRIGSRLLVVGGGLTSFDSVLSTCEVLDLNQTKPFKAAGAGTSTGTGDDAKWISFPPLQKGRYGVTLVACGDRVFAIAGGSMGHDTYRGFTEIQSELLAVEMYTPPVGAISTSTLCSGSWSTLHHLRVAPLTKATLL